MFPLECFTSCAYWSFPSDRFIPRDAANRTLIFSTLSSGTPTPPAPPDVFDRGRQTPGHGHAFSRIAVLPFVLPEHGVPRLRNEAILQPAASRSFPNEPHKFDTSRLPSHRPRTALTHLLLTPRSCLVGYAAPERTSPSSGIFDQKRTVEVSSRLHL